MALPIKNGREDVEDESCLGLTSRTDENMPKFKTALNKGRHFNLRLITEEVGMQKTVIHSIITV